MKKNSAMTQSMSSNSDSVTADHRSAAQASNVAVDACVLINFLRIRRIDILGKVSQYQFQILDAVDAEVTKPEQRCGLDAAHGQRIVYRADPPSVEETREFANLTPTMGRGEAACLAAAQCRGWMIASDEKGRFKRTAVERIGRERIIGTADIIYVALCNGNVTAAQADQIKARLEGHAFKMPFHSFRDLLKR